MIQLRIKQIRSIIDRPEKQKRTIEALGLGRPNWVKVHNDTPQIRGMINKVTHLVVVEEFENNSDKKEEKKKVIRKKPAVKKAGNKKTTVKKKTAKSK